MNHESKSFDQIWERDIYSQKRQINRYPFGDIVSYVMGLYGADLKAGKKLRVLEVGFGAGNNLAFFAKEGFETYGIEGSESACRFAKEILGGQGLKVNLTQGDFVKLPYEDGFFDFVVDREAVYANRKAAIMAVSNEVYRCLKPGGHFLSFCYSTQHGDLEVGGGELIEPNTYTNFKVGSFVDTGAAHFFTESEVRNEYFKNFEIKFMFHHRNDQIFPVNQNQYAEFITCGQKPVGGAS